MRQSRNGKYARTAREQQRSLGVTKKDYIKIAKILKTTDLDAHKRASLAVSFAQVCREDNPRFDIQRFLDACGVTTPKAELNVLEDEEKFIRAVRGIRPRPDAFRGVPKEL